MSVNRKILESLKAASAERQVEDAYNEMLKSEFSDAKLTYPCNCDGYFESDVDGKKLRCICEFKYDYDLSKKSERSKILAQVVFYMKKFETEGMLLPNVVFVGDKNECFFVHTNHLIKWLDLEGVDWAKPPSHAYEQTKLMEALVGDDERNVLKYDVDDGFDFSEIASQMRAQATGVIRYVHVTEHNVDKVFKLFCEHVLKNSKSIPPNDLVALFFGAVCDRENCYKHPAKRNVLVAGNKEYKIDEDQWKAFQKVFAYIESSAQKAHLAAISDRLVEDANRRRKGEFYTPTAFVDECHRRASAFLGENWRDEYIVIDPAAGTKNLERDYHFKKLYLSTLEQAELDISKKYCPEAKATSVLDFLNSTDEELFAALPGLEDALKADRKVVWLMNPPYGKVGKSEDGAGFKGIEIGSAKTEVNKQMRKEKLGACAAQLYAQFLYRIMQLKKKYKDTNFTLVFFCCPAYLSSEHFEKFRELFLKEFKFEGGMLFCASHFADTSANWGINFSIWSSGETIDKNMFKHDLMDIDENGDITKVGEKELYNIGNKISLGDWVREPIKNLQTDKDHLPLTSALKVCSGKIWNSTFHDNLGFFYNKGNGIGGNASDVSIFSSMFSAAGGIGINKNNFTRCCAAFAARRLVKGDWINCKDEYTAPNVNDPAYKNFEADSLVFSLFESASQQSSLRDVEYKGRKWNVRNQFCWYPKSLAEKLADENGFDAIYADAHTATDPYMVKALANAEPFMSDEAKAVLAKALELVEKSFKYRGRFADDYPEYQTDKAWDLGYYQIKAILKTYMPDELKNFRELTKKLADKMRPAVYELGFLKK